MRAFFFNYCKTLIIRAHLIFAKFANSLKSRNFSRNRASTRTTFVQHQ